MGIHAILVLLSDNTARAVIFSMLVCIGVWTIIDYVRMSTWVQIKEYRRDRIRDFLQTAQGKHWFFNRPFVYVHLIVFLSVCVHSVWPYTNRPDFAHFFNLIAQIFFLMFGIAILELAFFGYKKLKKTFVAPKITKKLLLLVLTSFLIEIGLFLGWTNLLSEFPYIFFIFAAGLIVPLFLRPTILCVTAWLLSFPTTWAKAYYVARARKKLLQYPNLMVIGITGSYGKSSVKTFLSTVLETKKRIITTPKNINTEIGVARFILASDFTDKEIFVCEMGAYTKGEIKLICDMVYPKIGILTTVAPQHLSLFGSMQAIQKTKYELLRALPHDSLAITNADNAYCREFLGELTARTIQTFGHNNAYTPTARIVSATATQKGITGSLEIAGKHISIEAPVYGVHQMENIAPVYLVAAYLGMSEADILSALQHIHTPEGTLRVQKSGNITVIDDSYNANPDGFVAALTVLETIAASESMKRIVISRGMLELADQEESGYKQVADKMRAALIDELWCIDQHAYDMFNRLLQDTKVAVIFVQGVQTLHTKIEEVKKNDQVSVVLIENRVPFDIDAEFFT